jgi:hypothetical protein
MKKLKIYSYFLFLMIMGASCNQELVDNDASPCPSDDPSIICPEEETDQCAGATAGTANFSDFVAMGSSYTAGFQAGALFNEGQENSLAKILSTQFACVGGGAFNQPAIRSVNGYNIFVTPNPVTTPAGQLVLGRFKLQGTPPKPTPMMSPVTGSDAIPNPQVNAAFQYTGSTGAVPPTQLNNFAVQATLLAQTLSNATGNWGNPNPAVGFSPFYARFASNPGTSTILNDAIAADGTFYMLWSGMDDYLLYAAFGGDPTKAPLTPSAGGVGVGFTNTYGTIVGAILASDANLKMVVGNFPSVFALPHFTSVPWNAIPLDATTAAGVTTNLANNYNAFLDGMAANAVITADEAAKRKLTYVAGQNAILLTDETLTDLAPYMTGPYAGLLPYARARQTKSSDILPLAAGSILGTLADPGNASSVYGVSVPLADQYVLIPTEIAAIETARTEFNATIAAVAAANSARVALADVNATFNSFLTAKAAVANGITVTPNINPPTGIYSEDGMHPNSRGYAFIANIFIDAINAKFGATVPKVNLAKYSATGLPINP